MRVVAVGECMVELREDSQRRLSYGFAGDTLNVATYLRRLLPVDDWQVDYLTALGDDPISERMLAAWRQEGIGTGLVARRPGELPGLYWIHNHPDGERAFYYWRRDAAARQMFRDGHAALAAALEPGDLLYLSGISLAILPPGQRQGLIDALDRLRGRGVKVGYDSNYRARLWDDVEQAAAVQREMRQRADVLFTTFADESAMMGDRSVDETAERLRREGVAEWVLRGEPGVTVTRESGLAAAVPTNAGRVIDTTGAGDSFDAAYLAARLTGAGVATAVQAGHALAAAVVQQGGAIIARAETPPLSTLVQS